MVLCTLDLRLWVPQGPPPSAPQARAPPHSLPPPLTGCLPALPQACRAAAAVAAAMNKLIFADSAGPAFQRIYNNSHFALAALLPASLVSPQVRVLGAAGVCGGGLALLDLQLAESNKLLLLLCGMPRDVSYTCHI